MTLSLLAIIPAVDDVLFYFAQSDGFWANLETAFGTSYDVVKATELRQQWKSRNFSQIPPIEVLSDEVLGTANGAYSSSTNKIYLSASFLNTASSAAIINVILEEIGHYVDAQINPVDSAGDEGAIFAELVQGNSLDVATLDALRAENDQTTIIVNGESIQVEQADFTGTPGNDNITGTSGDDNIYGLGGNDTLNAGDGADFLEGGDGDDLLSGGSGNDGDSYWVNSYGLYGGDGNDTLDGGTGDDYLDPGEGNDTINGGSGIDTMLLNYGSQTAPITITYTNSTNGTSSVGDSFQSIEIIKLTSGSGNDVLNLSALGGNGSAINGSSGNDSIISGVGHDILDGSDGNDTLNGNDGEDALVGGDGDDVLLGGAGNEKYWNYYFNTGIYGGNGNDSLDGGSGDDYLDPGEGNDTINGGSGIDTMLLNYGSQTAPITITYTNSTNGTSSVGDSFQSIEIINLTSGSGNDVLNLSALSGDGSIINGSSGNDSIISGVGRDILDGSDGNDTLNGNDGQDRLVGGDGDDVLLGGAGNDQDSFIVDIWPNYPYSSLFYAGIYGGNGNDSLDGGSGDDYLDPGEGNDTINGGSGNDTMLLNYGGQTAPITITYTNSTNGTSSVGDSFQSIEIINLTSGSGNDVLNLSALSGDASIINGGGGNDSIISGIGWRDILDGSDGNDTLNGNDGQDRLVGGDGDDVLLGGAGNEQAQYGFDGGIYGGNGNDTLQGTNNGIGEQDYLEGGTGNDRFILADTTKTFYDDGNSTLPGDYDYATIADFNTTDDTIQLRGSSGDYLLSVSGSNTNLYINKPGSEPDELIAYISNQTALSLTASYFSYVSSPTLPSITLAVSPASVTEDGTANLIYTFTRTGVTTNALTVNYTLGGTATLNTDYTRTGTTNTVTFAAGSSTATVTIDPTADTIVESNETVILTLAAGTGYTIGTTTPVTGTINNDDTSVTSQLSINNITVVEGLDNNAILTVTVNNSNPQPITFNYTTAPINATANVDYTSKTGTITIAANTSTATISIPILNDNLNEPDEAFTVTLSNPVNATINPDEAIGQVIITDTLQSAITRTLPNNVENLRLIGTNNINGTGNAGNNNITGNSGINQINGRAGIDTLTGGLGADTFIFQFGQSTISTSDRITDFAINSDKIDLLTQGGTAMSAPSNFSRAANSTVTTLQNLINQVFTDANGAITGNQGLGVNSAALVQVTTGAIAGTYLVINDSAAGFQSSNDLLINITGFTGTLPALGSIPVGNFFV
ncbi:hemolysin-type calcium-binding repeat family protein [Microcystis aeruginosa TAIHU98]|uniref:Hemolysin-type calcium-binding repeat family protein n=1 Tax=Microcystis aeruginosa TAIHU98 TaxID=1134457 RepID=L7E6Z8_MICAE|nr:Calx-beta domain-containing protein [Microcystis aeruginosa]ELP54814.1 hemolysin-type calcium-binding repeat family protein [Microcystis aeruginosa TAIHU98]